MKPTHFRAYAADGAVHNPVNIGAVEAGAAKFKASREIAYVVFYDHKQDSPTVVGRVDGPFAAGKIAVSLPTEE
jgi:hypothetical protein